jgi:O-antigen ligase
MQTPGESTLKTAPLRDLADDAALAADPFESARRLDVRGHRIHVAAAALYCFSVAIAQAPEGISLGLLLFMAVVRLRFTWRTYALVLRQPVVIAFSAWAAWTALSLAWTPDVQQGIDELQDFRVLLVMGAFWPVLDRMPLFIGSLLAGIATQNIVQLATLPSELQKLDPRDGLRVRGLLQPIQTGAFCAAAIAWHLASALLARGRTQILSWTGLVLAAVGLLITGSRGPWLSAAASVPLATIWLAFRYRAARLPAVLLIAGALLTSVAAWPLIGDKIEGRIQSAVEQWHAAVDEGDYSTDVGLRVMLAKWSWRFLEERPLTGHGAGSFHSKILASAEYPQLIQRFPDKKPEFFAPGHPHSSPMHVLASTGAVGGVLFLATILLLLVAAVRNRHDTPYSAVHGFVLLGWLIGSLFDCYHLNAHQFGLFALLVTFTLAHRPRITPAMPIAG